MKIFQVDTITTDRAQSSIFRMKGFEQAEMDVIEFDWRAVADRAGEQGMNDVFYRSCSIFRPDILFINKGHMLDQLHIAKLKEIMPHMMVVTFCGDQRGKVMEEILPAAQVSHVLLVSNKDQRLFDGYKTGGVRKVVEHHCATDTDVFKSHQNYPESFRCDVCFIGSNYKSFPLSEFRYNLLVKIDRHFNLRVYGGNSWHNLKYGGYAFKERNALVASAAKVHLAVNAFNTIHRYTSNRTWTALSCGTLVLQHRFPGCESLLGKDKENLAYFTDHEDCLEKIGHYLNNPKEREEIAARGREFVKNHHTYYHRALEIKELYREFMEEDNWEWRK